MKVPYFRVAIPESAIESVNESIRSGWLTTGKKTKDFETRFAGYYGASHAIATNSCTAGLHLSLEAAGIQQGDLVLVPTMTFAATGEVVRYFDAVPVFVDCDDAMNMDPAKLEETIHAIRANKPVAGLEPPYGPLKAVMPMHYGGYACDMQEIMRIANENDLLVIEDAAHAVPGYYRPDESSEWQLLGTFGKAGVFSFYANKCISTGEGGMVITDDEKMAERIRVMTLHGMNRDAWKRYTSAGSWYYEIIAPGYKYNMTDIAAALGLDEMDRIETYLQRRTEIATAYVERLRRLDAIQLPVQDPATRRSSWHLFSIRLNLEKLSIDRATFIDEMKAREVMCSMHWLPLHLMPYYRNEYGYDYGLFENAERDWKRQISLPIFPAQTDEQVDAVCSAVESIVEAFHK
ncbi:aminotransferase class I/II-fold pyridoxal phosphate-dependent enzyme [bacterium]|nr:aminotransferase class I/II-fold pyridoxal phosphate-dependent enzyme [bacterium]